jgi:uncharacterized protein YjbI with pentapeptide repeats
MVEEMPSALMVLRAVSGIAMPLAVGAVYFKRRSRARLSDPEPEPRGLIRLTPSEVRRRLDQGGHLRGVDLTGARLDHIDLRGRRLSGLDLSRASLRHAQLTGADLSASRLDFADLSGATLKRANLTGASMLETMLWGADLSGADLSGSRQLIMAGLRRARFDQTTLWPPGFDPQSAGAEFQRS